MSIKITKAAFRIVLAAGALIFALAGCGGGGGGDSGGGAGTTAVPTAPVGVNVTGGDAQATIAWGNVSGATSYNIYWGYTAGVTKLNGSKIAGATSPYSHTSLANGITYYYVVTAVNAGGESAESAEVSVTPQLLAPSAPTVVVASAGNAQSTISWNPVAGASSYNLYWSTSAGVSKLSGTKIAGAVSPYVHSPLTNGTTYYYVVTAANAGGESAESAQTSVTPNIPPPVTISNLHDKGVVQTGFVIGTANYPGLTAVQLSLDGGATWNPATGTASWKFMLPTGSNTWKPGSLHTIKARATDGINFSTPTVITLRKGTNKDVNGDGYADLAVGAESATVASVYNSGAAYVFHGSATGVPSATASVANSTVTGTLGSYFGSAVALGDVNGDGYADLIVGAFGVTVGGNANSGAVYVFHGSATGVANASYTAANTALTGINGNMLGSSLAVGDVNGDGYADVAVGEPSVATIAIFHGSSSGVSSASVTSANAVVSGTGNSYFGYALAFGDVNSDGYDDLAVGEYTNCAEAYVFNGSATGIASSLTPNAAVTVAGPSGCGYFGSSLVLGDVNGDGYADLAVGAKGANSNLGAAYIFNGSASGITSASASSANATLAGSGLSFGFSLSMGDVNGDGYADIAVGADADSVSLAGAAYVFVGSASGIGNVNVSAASAIVTGSANGYFGRSVMLSDLNADGFADLSVGADGMSSSGSVYVFQGSITGVTSAAYTGAVTTLTGVNSASSFGRSLGD